MRYTIKLVWYGGHAIIDHYDTMEEANQATWKLNTNRRGSEAYYVEEVEM